MTVDFCSAIPWLTEQNEAQERESRAEYNWPLVGLQMIEPG